MTRALAGLALCFALACSSSSASKTAAPPPPPSKGPIPDAMAQIESRSGSSLVGSARFTSVAGGGVTAHVVIAGAAPGDHGVHIHETGDCTDPKAASAGGHFNPGGAPHHGGTSGAERHGGDLGNITVDGSGNGATDVTVPGLSIRGDTTGIIGRSIVVHEKPDDMKTDPSGNSGSRQGCGVIEIGK